MEEIKKLPVAERVEKKTMGMTKWFTEQYFQTFAMVSKDPRYKTLPPYNQTSCIATIIIATNGALDKIREKDARGMLAQQGSWVFSDVDGFPARNLPDYGTATYL